MSKISVQEHNKRMHLYFLGYSDRKIAKECSTSFQNIRQWRVRNNLPPLFKMYDIRHETFI